VDSDQDFKAQLEAQRQLFEALWDKVSTLEATQGQILSQSSADATRFWWHLYGS